MIDEPEINECESARQAIAHRWDAGIVSGAEGKLLDEHLPQCSYCRAWQEQNRELMASTRELRQFDVPEALTQRILFAVESERESKASLRSTMVMIVLVAIGVAFAIAESYETVEGLLSWTAALAGMVLIKMFLSFGQISRQKAS